MVGNDRQKKMGDRPADFDEEMCKKAPTYKKWISLKNGEILRYACRDFEKGSAVDEERLLRRIMIARRNNVKQHKLLLEVTKETRQESKESAKEPYKQSDAQVHKEMDHKAVEQTRSFKQWLKLSEGCVFTYNQLQYIKGQYGHEWLFKKNIWRRMRYRRKNQHLIYEHQKRRQEIINDRLRFSTNRNKNDSDQSSTKHNIYSLEQKNSKESESNEDYKQNSQMRKNIQTVPPTQLSRQQNRMGRSNWPPHFNENDPHVIMYPRKTKKTGLSNKP